MKEIKFMNGTVCKEGTDSELVSYELKEDNPCHCLQIHFGSLRKGTIAIYPDMIGVLPEGMDGFTVKFKENVPFKIVKMSKKV